MAILWLWLFLLQSHTAFPFFTYNNTTSKTPFKCRQDQRQLLLQLNQQLHPDRYQTFSIECDGYRPNNYYKTKYWKKSWNCCEWDGVTCDESTGFVIGLDLSCGGLSGNIHSNSSLFHLTHLRRLNLAFNNFTGSQISSGFGRLNTLTHLNLSHSGFSGRISPEFYYLSDLVSLDMSRSSYYDDTDLRIKCDVKLLFGNMTKIRVVSLAWVNISSEISINMSSFLTHLDLLGTGLQGNLPMNLFERPNLQVLSLGGNDGLKGSFPESLNQSNVHSLKELDLSEMSISGRLPDSIGFMNNLDVLALSDCKLWGPIPESIGNLTEITVIDLSSNELSGQVPSTISNLRRLSYLYLSWNHLEGRIPDAFADLQRLAVIDLSNNSLGGQIPPSLTNLSSLRWLYLSSNALTGHFPYTPGPALQRLEFLDLSNNSIEGDLPWQHLENLTYVNLQSNIFHGTFPTSICNLSQLIFLDLSYNTFSGKIPECIGNLSLQELNLNRNEFDGRIPTTLGENKWLNNLGLSHNHLEGPLPPSLANCIFMEVLDLGYNMIHDTFSSWLPSLAYLKILILKYNTFYGSINPPLINNSFSELQILDLSYNNFIGLLPDNLFSTLLAMKNLDEAATNDVYLDGDNNYHRYSVILFVKGKYREFSRVLRIDTTIDLSNNNFNGHIPESLSHLTSLWLLNLSHNNISGSIPPAFGLMTKLEQLDLSSNQLIGGIPQTLTNLTFLEVLNLSHNHLIGPIPQSTQFSTFSTNTYFGNLGLCGPPVTKDCGEDEAPPPPIESQEKEDGVLGLMMGFTWQAVAIGYGCGVMIGIILENMMISVGKPKWFAKFYYKLCKQTQEEST